MRLLKQWMIKIHFIFYILENASSMKLLSFITFQLAGLLSSAKCAYRG